MKKGVMIYTWPADMQVLVSACPVFFLETCVGAWPGGHLYLSGQHALGPVRKKVPVIRHQPGKPWSLVLPWFMFHVLVSVGAAEVGHPPVGVVAEVLGWPGADVADVV